jgi:hypothetical protein
MKYALMLLCLDLCFGCASASAAVSFQFEKPSMTVESGEEFVASIQIDADASQGGVQPLENGLFSFGIKVEFDPAVLEIGADGVFVVPALNYSGFIPGAEVQVNANNIIIKGNILLESQNSPPYEGSLIAEIVFRNIGASPRAALTLDSARSNPNEVLILDGQGNALDNTAQFHAAEVQFSSGSGTTLSIAATTAGSFVISFTPNEGMDHFPQTSSDLLAWTDVPGGPFNGGSVTLPSAAGATFFRVRSATP